MICWVPMEGFHLFAWLTKRSASYICTQTNFFLRNTLFWCLNHGNKDIFQIHLLWVTCKCSFWLATIFFSLSYLEFSFSTQLRSSIVSGKVVVVHLFLCGRGPSLTNFSSLMIASAKSHVSMHFMPIMSFSWSGNRKVVSLVQHHWWGCASLILDLPSCRPNLLKK